MPQITNETIQVGLRGFLLLMTIIIAILIEFKIKDKKKNQQAKRRIRNSQQKKYYYNNQKKNNGTYKNKTTYNDTKKNTNDAYEQLKMNLDVERNIYTRKSLRTPCEEKFYQKLQWILRDRNNRVLQAQIPLSSVVEKRCTNGHAGELYRTIDFGIFDDSGNVLVLIELNDMSHLQQDRRYRDNKVHQILEDANIPLVTFWTNKPNEIDYITKVLWNYL